MASTARQLEQAKRAKYLQRKIVAQKKALADIEKRNAFKLPANTTFGPGVMSDEDYALLRGPAPKRKRAASKKKGKKRAAPKASAKSVKAALARWAVGNERSTRARRAKNKKRKAAGLKPIKKKKQALHWVKRHTDKRGRVIKRHLRNPSIPEAAKATVRTLGGVALAIGGLYGVVKLLDLIKPQSTAARVGILAGSAVVGGTAIAMVSPIASAMFMLPVAIVGVGAALGGTMPSMMAAGASPMAGVYGLTQPRPMPSVAGVYKLAPSISGLYDARALARAEEERRINGLFKLAKRAA